MKKILAIMATLTISLLLAAIALGGSAQAAGYTFHSNYSSNDWVRVQSSNGVFHTISPGTTISVGSWAKYQVRAGDCASQGVGGTAAYIKHCPTTTTWYQVSQSVWVQYANR